MKACFQIVGCSDIFCKDNDFSRQSVRLWLLFMMLSIINGAFFVARLCSVAIERRLFRCANPADYFDIHHFSVTFVP